MSSHSSTSQKNPDKLSEALNLENRIRARAYELYLERGQAEGGALTDWLRAEAEITGKKAKRTAA
ncbi:MAG TPA: DUF2934 domain-containing protein [Terriglobales bacterium]|nr:DUF2934 domain-containing protein [Terriglobales bacterium]